MNKILISVISDQTIPNLLLIKEFEGQYDSQLFITTGKMEEEGKSQWIEEAAGIIPASISRLPVDENNWEDITSKLNRYKWDSDPIFLVNLTGGTKIMSLAIYEYFSKKDSQIYYVAIGRNSFKEIFPNNTNTSIPFATRLNVEEYLKAHGISYSNKSSLKKPLNEIRKIYKNYKNKGYNIENLHNGYSAEWKNYFTGEWFEEYLYYLLKEDIGLSERDIILSVEIIFDDKNNKNKNDQELDIVFTLNNELYIVEAKVSIGKRAFKVDTMQKILFKISAINKRFGLRSHAFVITLADINSTTHTELKRKATILGIKQIISRKNFNELNVSDNIINKY